ncbi:MAG: efflux RND transporter periplasmic adaptor subunit, partial [Armatimonadetes bacterium]|nr:efflux RND transporter periplasmic adaptor subunit [Armatimonadota bacterium]
PVGRAKLILKVTDSAGKPVEGAQVSALAKMPGMDMGEREEPALPKAGEPGTYVAPAVFAMEGSYQATIKVTGPQGPATATIPLKTGQDTAVQAGGFSLRSFLPWLIGILIGAFILYRAWQAGQRPNWRAIFNRGVVSGLLALALMLGVSNYAIKHWRRAGAMTPVEAQAMEMSTPPPPGTAAVELAAVQRGLVESTIRYTGSAVGYTEQDVYPRVTGWIVWMPFYAGDRVRKGQLLARLDTSELQSRVDERRANRTMAEQMAAISQLEYQQALASVAQARAEVTSKEGALEEARRMHAKAHGMLKENQAMLVEARNELRAMQAELTAAQQERSEADAMLQSAQAMQPEAEAMLASMQADQAYWVKEIARMKALLNKGAVSQEEFQREEAMAKSADAKVRQAEAKLQAVGSDIRAARSRLAKTEAMVESALARISQMQARVQGSEARIEQAQAEIGTHAGHIKTAEGDLEAARANVRAMQAMANAATKKIGQAQAGVQEAAAALTTASVVKGYTEIRSLVDGVVTQRVISPGVLVNPGQLILKIAQISPIRLQANVAEADLEKVRVGARAAVRSQNHTGKPVVARVTTITPAVDPIARTGVVEAVIPNRDSRFLPGQYVVMEISTGRSADALRVPASAIRWRTPPSGGVLSTQPMPYVWVAEPSAREGEYAVRAVDVQVGLSNDTYAEILSGLEEGQQVVVAGYQDLRNGDTVLSVVTPAGAQQYTCPMHPEVVKDQPGRCPKCGMNLVPLKEKGQAGTGTAPPADHAQHAAPSPQRDDARPAAPAAGAVRYVCPMDKEIVQDQPGRCPKCGMELVPQTEGKGQ